MSVRKARWISRVARRAAYLLLAALVGCSSDRALSPEQRAEAEVLFESCLICHSTQEMQRGPIIDGLPVWYTRLQLQKFRSGVRGQNALNKSEQLMGAARDKFETDAEIELLARYIAERPVQPYDPVVRGDAVRGEILYTSCIPCHGARGEGNETLKSPPLNLQEDWYLLDQLRKFASGKRGYHSDDFEGIQMAYALAHIDAEGLKDLVAYMQGFQDKREQDADR